MSYLLDLARDIHSCRRCGLCKTRKQAVPGAGLRTAHVMIVGEAPGETEDRQGRPFVGRCGCYLTKLLTQAGFEGRWCFVTNLVKCRPPGNRAPTKDEIASCDQWLRSQIVAVQPKMILCFGRYAGAHILGKARSTLLKMMRGQWHQPGAIPVRVLPHPSYVMQYGRDQEDDLRYELSQIAERARGEMSNGKAGQVDGVQLSG